MSRLSDFEKQAVAKLLVELKKGVIPWRPSYTKDHAFQLPMNPVSGVTFKGMNSVLLLSQGRPDYRWTTYDMAHSQGWQVKRGQKSITLMKFINEEERKDDNGNIVKVQLDQPKFFPFYVFNATQIEGIPDLPTYEPAKWDNHERLEMLIKDLGVDLRHGGNQCYYSPVTDHVQLPNRDQFPTLQSYSSNLLHEVGHWTGAKNRLDRDQTAGYGTPGYAYEELVAEMSSLFMGAELDIPHDFQDHAGYIQHWVTLLESNPKAIFKAASQAGKVKTFLMEHEKTWTPEIAKSREQAPVVMPALSFHITGLEGGQYETLPEAMTAFLADRDAIMHGHNLVMTSEGKELSLIGHDWVNDGSFHRFEFAVPEVKGYHSALIRKDTTPEQLQEAELKAIQAVQAYPALRAEKLAIAQAKSDRIAQKMRQDTDKEIARVNEAKKAEAGKSQSPSNYHMLIASRDQELSYYPVLQKTIVALEELKPEDRPGLLKEASRDVLVEYAQVRRGEHPSVALGSDRIAHAEFYESQFAKWQPDFAKQVALEWGNNMRRYSDISGLSPDRVHATGNAVFWEAERELKRRDRPIVADEIAEEWALRAEHLCTKTKVWPHKEDADNTRKLLTVAAAQLRDGDWNLAVENLKDSQAYEGLQDIEMRQNGMMALFDEVQNTWTRWQQQNGLGRVVTPRMKREFEALPKNLAEITPESSQAIEGHIQQTRRQGKTPTQNKSNARGASR